MSRLRANWIGPRPTAPPRAASAQRGVMPGEDTSGPETLGRIALKQVRVSRAEAEARARETTGPKSTNPMNRLVPYLDLFGRLGDDELARLSGAPLQAVEGLRIQVDEVHRALGRFADLLPRLSDDELARLTGATTKTIRFWRLSQPRHLQGEPRRSNPDMTPSPQPLPRRNPEDSSEVSSGTLSAASSSSTRGRAPLDAIPEEVSVVAQESSTFIIDTVE
jgi:hypothetical protein